MLSRKENYERNYGIDSLKLVLMFMVGTLHVLGRGGILEQTELSGGGVHFWILEILAYCAVDGFALISGYTAQNKKINYQRIVSMWLQVFFYSFIVSIVLILLGFGDGVSIKELIKYMFPLTFGMYWYFSAYFILFLAIPLLNKFLYNLKDEEKKSYFWVIVVLFSIMGVVADSFATNRGYSAIWLIILYCLGFLIKELSFLSKCKSSWLVIIILLNSILTLFIYKIIGIERILNYHSPTILLNAIILVVVFSKIVPTKVEILKKTAPLAFGIYLFQLNPVIWKNVLNDRFTYVYDLPIIYAITLVLFYSSIIFFSGLLIEYIRVKLFKFLKFDRIECFILNVFIKFNKFFSKLISN